MFNDPQIRARGMLVDVEHPRMGRQKAVRNPVLMDHDGPSIARAAPLLGEHTAENLRELGFAQARIEALATAGAVMLGPVTRA